jgi:hypothetical protein
MTFESNKSQNEELLMQQADVRKFLHDLNNYLNAATLNACLLRRLNGDTLDKESIDRLDQALRDADVLAKAFRAKVLKDGGSTTENTPTASVDP